ncbi:hypothetical protein Ga0466249_001369 [Sporomusaceae bacterium BoRhaA]|uniref:hypothetical protein n=1 Tax=Pelorhabdus rhamnosifermentans TaxID=2772457 RepID=UPI001C0635CB|nr:hypothetical protein [Pelorhabdus rhamnosifermentans]MBU2700277.1 hypothetical protein [Pelorhabdus rhamnosifermentans]
MHKLTPASSWQLLFSYWYSKEALLAWGLLLVTILLILGIVTIYFYPNIAIPNEVTSKGCGGTCTSHPNAWLKAVY